MVKVLKPLSYFLLGGVVGAIATNWAALVEVDAEDWLAFAGGLVGVSLTILGAVWLEQWKQSQAKSADLELIGGALQELLDALQEIPEEGDEPAAFQWDANRAGNLLNRIDEAIDVLEYARGTSRLSSVQQILEIHRVEKALVDANETLEREGKWIEAHGDKANVLEQFNANIRGLAEDIRPKLKTAIKVIR